VTVEMELCKESTHGRVDPCTGHVPGFGEVKIHPKIHALYKEGEKDASTAPGGAGKGNIKDEDLQVMREQLQILKLVLEVKLEDIQESEPVQPSSPGESCQDPSLHGCHGLAGIYHKEVVWRQSDVREVTHGLFSL
jgi:hypothetical protein